MQGFDHGFTRGQAAGLAILGALFWFTAAMVVRFFVPLGALTDWAAFVTFALVVPVTYAALQFSRAVTGFGVHQYLHAAALMTGTALLLDGIALTWFTRLYGDDVMFVLPGAASILWGAGVALALGFVLERREPSSGASQEAG